MTMSIDGAGAECGREGRHPADRRHAEEARHRLFVRTGVALLLMLSLVPATGQPASIAEPFLDRCRELVAQCALVVRALSAPLYWFPLALLLTGVILALVDRVRLSGKVSRVLHRHLLRRVRPDDPVAELAAEFDCLSSVRLIVGVAPNPAFTAGLWRPRMYLGETLQASLTRAELRAVFRHELHHVRRRDPLRFAVLRFAAKTLFWLPLVGALVEDLMEDAEVVADDFAAAPAGGTDPLDVASALVKIGRANAGTMAGVAALGGFRLLDRRVKRLANEAAVIPLPLRWRPALLSAAALLALWVIATLPPRSVDATMTMRWGDRCPHAMQAAHRRCPACDDKPLHQMPGCDH